MQYSLVGTSESWAAMAEQAARDYSREDPEGFESDSQLLTKVNRRHIADIRHGAPHGIFQREFVSHIPKYAVEALRAIRSRRVLRAPQRPAGSIARQAQCDWNALLPHVRTCSKGWSPSALQNDIAPSGVSRIRRWRSNLCFRVGGWGSFSHVETNIRLRNAAPLRAKTSGCTAHWTTTLASQGKVVH